MAQGFRQGKDPAVLGTAQLLQKQSQLKLTQKFSETVQWLTILCLVQIKVSRANGS